MYVVYTLKRKGIVDDDKGKLSITRKLIDEVLSLGH